MSPDLRCLISCPMQYVYWFIVLGYGERTLITHFRRLALFFDASANFVDAIFD